MVVNTFKNRHIVNGPTDFVVIIIELLRIPNCKEILLRSLK